jgi:hypothetical protein
MWKGTYEIKKTGTQSHKTRQSHSETALFTVEKICDTTYKRKDLSGKLIRYGRGATSFNTLGGSY